MKRKLDLDNWNRKEHFNYFRKFDEPFYNLTADVDCTAGYKRTKAEGGSLFTWYLYNAIKASNQLDVFRYRIEGDEVWEYETIHASPTISREDGTFGFAQVDFYEDYEEFREHAMKEIERVKATKGLFTAPERPDVIHYSAIPWFSFKGLTHPRNFSDGDSIPKISFGKIYEDGNRKLLPLSVHVHHALIDGFHVGQFVELFTGLLNE